MDTNLQAITFLVQQGRDFLNSVKEAGKAVILTEDPVNRSQVVKTAWNRKGWTYKARAIGVGLLTPLGWAMDATRWAVAAVGACAGAAVMVVSTVGAALWGSLAWLTNAARKGVNALITGVKGKAKAEPVVVTEAA